MDSKIHDYGYAYLFEDPEMVRQLLETCVDEGWVSELVIEELEPMNTNHVDKRLIRRQDDVLLRAKLRGREVYILIVLEFQSTPDRFMTLRLLNYQCMVWLSLVERSRRAKGEPTIRNLPPIFPVVLYNGARAWNEPRRLEDLVVDADLGARFMNWVQARFHDDNRRKDEVRTADIQKPGGLDTMLETAIKERAEKERQEGRQEGHKEGHKEGRLQVARKALATGMSPADVAELTDLTLEEVQRLTH